jgi:hypothetical protein
VAYSVVFERRRHQMDRRNGPLDERAAIEGRIPFSHGDRTCDMCEYPFPVDEFPGTISEHVDGWFHDDECRQAKENEEASWRARHG